MSATAAEVKTVRRYYWAKYVAANARGDEAVADVWKGKWQAYPATPLPSDFPELEALAAAGYTAVEDLNGASLAELAAAGLSSQAEAILAALEPLIT